MCISENRNAINRTLISFLKNVAETDNLSVGGGSINKQAAEEADFNSSRVKVSRVQEFWTCPVCVTTSMVQGTLLKCWWQSKAKQPWDILYALMIGSLAGEWNVSHSRPKACSSIFMRHFMKNLTVQGATMTLWPAVGESCGHRPTDWLHYWQLSFIVWTWREEVEVWPAGTSE